MNTLKQDLGAALRERLAIISDAGSRQNPEEHMKRLQAISETIERLSNLLPKPIDPRLAHFLERRSYDKALELLDDNAPSRR